MHFHLPKPLHGWREFAGEVVIIVVGVLIALGAEQIVETLHWRREAQDAQESLRNEIADHAFSASEVVITQPCIDQQLATLEQTLFRPGPYAPAPSYQTVLGEVSYRAPSRDWADNVWRTVVGEGIASHFDPDLRLTLSSYYTQLATMRDSNQETDQLSRRLRILSRPIQPDAAARLNLIQELEEARAHFAFMKLVGNQLLGTIEDMKMLPPPEYTRSGLADSGTLQFCRAHHLPLGAVTPQHLVIRTIRDFEAERRQR